MSHFAGLVVLTPDYLKEHCFEDALAKYDESIKTPEYSIGEVDDFDKIRFIDFYSDNKPMLDMQEKLYEYLVEEGDIEAYDPIKHGDKKIYLMLTMREHKKEYVEIFQENYPKLFDDFGKLYEEKGEDWNHGSWRLNQSTGQWEEYSTYNPDSKYDWYDCRGRWSGCLKTKSGKYVNECHLGEIDWSDFKPEDYEGEKGKLKDGVKFHFNKSLPPFCLIVDGQWFEKGEMGYWCITTNEKSQDDWGKQFFDIIGKLPEDSEAYNIDFHI